MACFSLVGASEDWESDFSRTAWGKGQLARPGKGLPRGWRPQGKLWVQAEADADAATFPLLPSSGHPGLPFPLLSAPPRAPGVRDGEGDPCRRQGRGNRGGLPLPLRAPRAAVTHLSGPTGIGSAGRTGRGLPQERAGPRAVGSGGSVRVPGPAATPALPSCLTRTFRPPASAAAAPRSGSSVPPASPNHSGRRGPERRSSAVHPSAKVWLPWSGLDSSSTMHRGGLGFRPPAHAGRCSSGCSSPAPAFWLT